MESITALSVLAVLFVAWLVVHRIGRRQKMRRRAVRSSRSDIKRFGFKPKKSARSEMHANEDPTTIMGDLSVRKRPRAKSREKPPARRGK
jgi:hypothetical protein